MVIEPDEERFNEGISLLKQGKVEEAIDIFSELVEKDEKDDKAWNAFGVALSYTSHKESAIHCFENALHLDPDNALYRRNLSRAKSPPIKKKSPKLMELTEQKKRGGIIRPLFIGIVCLLGIGLLLYAFTSGALFGVTEHSLIPGLFPVQTSTPQPTPLPEIAPITITPTPTKPELVVTPVPLPTPTPKPVVLFHFINVGQGDAALIQSEGKNILIDAGPSPSGNRLVDYLKSQNVSSLDMIVASHPFDDHIGGMEAVLKAFPVKSYIDNGEPYSSDLYSKVINLVTSDQTIRTIVTAGMNIPFTSIAKLDVIGPYSLTGHPDEDSLILKFTVQNVTVLFPGDSSDVRSQATILKVPDHGSDNAIGPIMNVRPEVAVISVGAGNSYDYPRSGTLDALQKINAQIFRTDQNGTIIISTDGTNWTAKTTR